MLGVIETPPHLASLQVALGDGLTKVRTCFDTHLRFGELPVDELCRHVERYRGKMLRPILVLTCGMASRSDQNRTDLDAVLSQGHIVSAAVCEMVHMATLVHDDVLDEAAVRRGVRTINSLRGNEAAVMLGDLLIASAYDLCNTLNSLETSRLVSRTAMTVCKGELLQLHSRAAWDLSEASYYKIVSGKTGALIACACELGALHSGASPAIQSALSTFGDKLGIAFQIQDDLLDLMGDEKTVGKSVRKDLEKSKLTLPLIHHLRTSPAAQRAATISILESIDHDADAASANYAALIQQLATTKSVDFASKIATDLVNEAKAAIAILPPGPATDVLHLMADAVINREF